MVKFLPISGRPTIALIGNTNALIFSSPGRSPGRAIVLPPASALAFAAASALAKYKHFALKLFMSWAKRCQASYRTNSMYWDR